MILTNCRLIPELCEGFQEEMADIRIEEDKIAEILPAGGHYTGEEVIDCMGKTVLPGLYNLHLHICVHDHDPHWLDVKRSEYDHAMNAVSYLHTLLAYGFTFIRDSGSPYAIAMKLRDRINAGQMAGPTMKAPGYILVPTFVGRTPTDNHSATVGRPLDGPIQCRYEARKQLAEGADYLKILGSAVRVTDPRGTGPLFYPDELEELAKVAKLEGTYIAVHTTSAESNQAAIDMEARTIEHALYLTKENIDSILAHGKKSSIVATEAVCMPWGLDYTKEQTIGIKAAAEAGIMVGWGTDTSESVFLKDPSAEWRGRELIGFSHMEILKQATIESAKIMGDDKERGSIAIGKKADLAIIAGKPDEDFSLFDKPCDYVVKNGKIVSEHGMIRHMLENRK